MISATIGAALEREVANRVARETELLRKDAEASRAALRAQELDLAIARWAIAGILSRNLHLRVELDLSQSTDPVHLATLVGHAAGAEFIHEAGIQFRQHAEYAALLDASRKNWTPHISTEREFEAHRAFWPKP